MRHLIRYIICTVMIAASLTLTVGAAETEQITTTGEETTITTTTTAATEEQTAEVPADAEDPEQTLGHIGAEVEDESDTEANGEKDTTDTHAGADLTEEEMRDMILRVAEAIGAYEEDLPAAGKAKEWIINNLASLVGFLMAISLIIATPIGKKIFTNFVTICKNTVTKFGEFNDDLKKAVADNAEKNTELRAAVNELMTKMTRENQEAIRRAEEAEARANKYEAELIEVKKEAAAQLAASTRTSEAVCRAALVMAKPLEMVVQHTKALDELQKHEVFTEYRDAVEDIHKLLNDQSEEEGGENRDD